jgi:hypothetical protein
VARHTTESGLVTNGQVDDILLKAGQIMQTADSSGDIACCVRFERDGALGIFSNTDGIVDTWEEMLDLLYISPAYNVKIVPALDFCGGYNTTVVGCAATSRSATLIVESLTDLTQNGILWAHEFGHNQGLSHPAGDQVTRIMNYRIRSQATQMIASECVAWHSTAANPGELVGPCPVQYITADKSRDKYTACRRRGCHVFCHDRESRSLRGRRYCCNRYYSGQHQSCSRLN